MKAKKYGWSSSENEPSHNYLLPFVVRTLRENKIQNVLDIGAGNGSLLPAWQKLGLNVSAMEPDEDGYNYCRKKENIDVKQLGVGDEMPSEWKNNFNAIISLEVVEHLFNPHDLVKTCDEVLKTNGLAIVSTPYHGYFKNLLLAIFNKWDFHHHPNRVGGHIKFYSKNTLSDLFLQQGFELVKFKGVGRFFMVWKSMILVFRKVK